MAQALSDKKSAARTFCALVAVPLLFGLAAFPIVKMVEKGHPASYLIANALLFTPFRSLTQAVWLQVAQYGDVPIPAEPIQEIDAIDFLSERRGLISTQHFRDPVVVRGIFKDTPAYVNWKKEGYLANKLGDLVVPLINDGTCGNVQSNRSLVSFRDAIDDIMTNENSLKYIFFPIKSRFHFGTSAEERNEATRRIKELVLGELQTEEKIASGFGTGWTFQDTQLVVGRGSHHVNATTGTLWHCALGNNWFAQVAGRKRWYFVDPKYSPLMQPVRQGSVSMMTGLSPKEIGHYQQFIPMDYVDLEAGDLLYNPDWRWHTIVNYEGLSIGVPMREFNPFRSFQQNFLYTAIALYGESMRRLGLSAGGYE